MASATVNVMVVAVTIPDESHAGSGRDAAVSGHRDRFQQHSRAVAGKWWVETHKWEPFQQVDSTPLPMPAAPLQVTVTAVAQADTTKLGKRNRQRHGGAYHHRHLPRLADDEHVRAVYGDGDRHQQQLRGPWMVSQRREHQRRHHQLQRPAMRRLDLRATTL